MKQRYKVEMYVEVEEGSAFHLSEYLWSKYADDHWCSQDNPFCGKHRPFTVYDLGITNEGTVKDEYDEGYEEEY